MRNISFHVTRHAAGMSQTATTACHLQDSAPSCRGLGFMMGICQIRVSIYQLNDRVLNAETQKTNCGHICRSAQVCPQTTGPDAGLVFWVILGVISTILLFQGGDIGVFWVKYIGNIDRFSNGSSSKLWECSRPQEDTGMTWRLHVSFKRLCAGVILGDYHTLNIKHSTPNPEPQNPNLHPKPIPEVIS